MTYNILEYSGSDSAIRNPYFRTVIRNTSPDILVIQEIHSQQALNGFLSNVMNAYGNIYTAGAFINGPDTDNGIFFKTSRFIFISNTRIPTAFRDINEFKLIHVNYPADTFRIFVVHLYPGSGITNENRRAAEVDSLRKYTSTLGTNNLYLVAGDFNITGSHEQAYIKLLQPGNGSFTDVLAPMPGIWDNPVYAAYHTMSSRTRSFGGGATGGLRNRFDMILPCPLMLSNARIIYIQNTMTAYGNDGNHYRDSINRRPNTVVADSIADALHYASDHIPVFASFKFGNPVGMHTMKTAPYNYELLQNYPNPFNGSTKFRFSIKHNQNFSIEDNIAGEHKTVLKIYNILGNEVATLIEQKLEPGTYELEWNGEDYPSGVYYYRLYAGDFAETRKMVLLK
ncbi:MAG: T9SS type A sorting domain-containing protein [Ignavibacteria bacterium]|nr:T9SS type A sorting domain-containing protein [Ignavibacteria bacterium]